MYLNLLIIQLIIVYIIDISGISNYIKKWVYNYFFKKSKLKMKYYDLELKPFLCSMCETWWISVIYVLIVDPSILNIGYAALMSFMAPISSEILMTIKDVILNILNKISRMI